ncbi:MAG: tRNA (adenosine(37)-N6)-threonylcarbamoyltransferase complex dimerization subunit type 1 TsaB [Gemmatimonadota bacterium]
MLLLALDTATPAGSVALLEGERVLAARHFDAGAHHSARLFVVVESALAAAGRRADEVEGVAVTIGPGSFTGLRIGLSAAKGFCLARSAPLAAVPTLEVLAARLPFCPHPVCALLDARRGEVYGALYDTSAGMPQLLEGPLAAAMDEVVARWLGGPAVCTGDGAAAHAELLAGLAGARLAPAHCRRPDAATVGALGLERLRRGEAADLAAVEPDYLRTPAFKLASAARP